MAKSKTSKPAGSRLSSPGARGYKNTSASYNAAIRSLRNLPFTPAPPRPAFGNIVKKALAAMEDRRQRKASPITTTGKKAQVVRVTKPVVVKKNSPSVEGLVEDLLNRIEKRT